MRIVSSRVSGIQKTGIAAGFLQRVAYLSKFTTWLKSHPLVDLHPDFRTDPILGVIDTCDYYFTY